MHIRKFQEKDAEMVSKIMKENFLEVNSREYSKETVAALIQDSTPARVIEKSRTRHYYVAVEDEIIIGIGGYKDDDIHTFFVDQEQQGKGVGKQLMSRVLHDAKKEGIKIMNCASTKFAEKFYACFGFERVEERTVPFYNTTLTFVQMVKSL